MRQHNPLNITPGASSVMCREHPEWGTFGIRIERGGEWYEIIGRSGSRVLAFSEAATFWVVVK